MLEVLGLALCFIGRGGSACDDKMVGGGINHDISKTPYMVSIHLDDPAKKNNPVPVLWDPICVGTIFTALYVVTACHCVVGEDGAGKVYPLISAFPLEKWAFVAGAWHIRDPDYALNPLTQRRTPATIRHHPKCRQVRTPWLRNSVPVNDVAVARMERPFDVDGYVKPARIFSFRLVEFEPLLDEIMSDHTRVRCTVSGWGSTRDISIVDALIDVTDTRKPAANCTTMFPDEDRYKLKFLKVQTRYEEDCLDGIVRTIRKHAGPNVVKDWDAFETKFRDALKKQICAANKNSSPCRGDSGCGLICDQQYIIGINSFGIGCGTPSPDVFQSVFAVLGWLEEVVCELRTCEDLKHLHHKCEIKAKKSFVDECLKHLHREDSVLMSGASIVVDSRWLIILMVNVT